MKLKSTYLVRARLELGKLPAPADFVAPAVEHLGITDGATGVREATLAGVAGVRSTIDADEDLVVRIHVLLLRKHVVAKGPEAHGACDHAENIDEAHVDLVG